VQYQLSRIVAGPFLYTLGRPKVIGAEHVPASGGALLRLPARFAASGRGVAAFLEKLLFTGGENKFLTAVATGK